MVQYCRPRDIAEAVEVLADAGPRGRVLAGGTDLLVHVRRQPLEPLVLVDLKRATDLPDAIELGEDSVTFGPTATMSAIARTPQVISWFPALVSACRVVGSVAIRNRATLVGNVCNASPAADTVPSLLVYGATITLSGPDGTRTMPLSDFFISPGSTLAKPGEVVVSLELAKPAPGYRSSFERLTRRRGVDLATVNVAAGVGQDNTITLGLGAVGPTPLLSATSPPVDIADGESLARTIEALVEVASPISDIRAGRDYRQAMVAVLSERAVLNAAGGFAGGVDGSH